jgi:hypothetical protein
MRFAFDRIRLFKPTFLHSPSCVDILQNWPTGYTNIDAQYKTAKLKFAVFYYAYAATSQKRHRNIKKHNTLKIPYWCGVRGIVKNDALPHKP